MSKVPKIDSAKEAVEAAELNYRRYGGPFLLDKWTKAKKKLNGILKAELKEQKLKRNQPPQPTLL